MQTSVQTMSGLQVALAVWHRRKWPALLILVVSLSTTVAVARSLPNTYLSTATVLVEYHQGPQTPVGQWTADDLETRLRTISQQIMSRSRLYELITRLGLYPDLRQQRALGNYKNTTQSLSTASAAVAEIVEGVRRNIELQFNGVRQPSGLDTTVAISLSYRGRDPETVARVTNALAALYVEENTKIREQQTAGATEFLQTQLEDAKRQLEDQDRKISAYKERHMGELPEQQVANLTEVERLNSQLRVIMERRDALTKGLGLSAATVDTTSARLAKLRQELAGLRLRYTDEHPDVVRVKQEISDLQHQPLADDGGRAAAEDFAPRQPRDAPTAVEAELAALRNEEQALRRAIADHERRIETAPLRELELQQLFRDEGSARELYQSLLQRYQSAQLTERIEQRQGEQFRILDPAVASRLPVGPNRFRLLLMGLIGGVGAAVGMALLAEAGDTSFHSVNDVRGITSVPVLVSIPQIVTETDARRRRRHFSLAVLAAVLGVVIVFGASSYLVHNGVLNLLSGRF